MHNDWHKVMNNEVCLKLKRGVAPSGFKLPKARKDHAIRDVRVLEEIHKRYTMEVFNKYIDIEEKSNMWVSPISLKAESGSSPKTTGQWRLKDNW